MDPVAQGLAIHATDLRRRSPIHSIANRRKRQKPPALIDALRVAGPAPEAPQPNSRLAISPLLA